MSTEIPESSTVSFGELIATHYEDLRAIAANRLRYESGAGRTPTSLTQETVVRLLSQRTGPRNEGQFLAVASMILRRILIDGVRRSQVRRGAMRDVAREAEIGEGNGQEEIAGEAAYEALESLRQTDPRKAEVVTLHIVCGLSLPRVAEVVGVSLPTVERDLRFAKAWLATRITGGAS